MDERVTTQSYGHVLLIGPLLEDKFGFFSQKVPEMYTNL